MNGYWFYKFYILCHRYFINFNFKWKYIWLFYWWLPNFAITHFNFLTFMLSIIAHKDLWPKYIHFLPLPKIKWPSFYYLKMSTKIILCQILALNSHNSHSLSVFSWLPHFISTLDTHVNCHLCFRYLLCSHYSLIMLKFMRWFS